MPVLWALVILKLCPLVKSDIEDVTGIKKEFKSWLLDIQLDLNNPNQPQQNFLCSNGNCSTHTDVKDWSHLKFLDKEQFSFDGNVDENGNPFGFGTLVKLAKDQHELVCLRSKCHSEIKSVTGNFSHGYIHGKGHVIYEDDSSLKTHFKFSLPFGAFLKTDRRNRHFVIGFFDKGQPCGNLWFHDFRTGHGFYGSASGQGQVCFFLSSSVICGAMNGFILRDGRKCNSFLISRNNHGMMELSSLQCETDSKELSFRFATNFKTKEDRLSAQLLWLHLKFSKKLKSIFLNGLTYEENAAKSQRLSTIIEEVSLQSIQCKRKLDLFQYPKNTVVEHLGLSYPGSGSKWIFHSISLFTGIKDCYLWIEHEPLYQRNSASLIKSQHQRAELYQKITPDVNRKSETMTWRLDHIYEFGGRAILLIRNPYESILAHWNHVLAGELELDREYLSTLHSPQFVEFAKIEIKLWLEILFDWIPISPNLMVLHFEDFKKDMAKELLRVSEFFRLEPDLERLRCVSSLENTTWRRNKRPKVRMTHFPPEIVALFDETIDQARILLQAYGFEDLPVNLYKIYMS